MPHWRSVGGRESAAWRTGLELARQGNIANLRVLALDVVSAPADGAPRCGRGARQAPAAGRACRPDPDHRVSWWPCKRQPNLAYLRAPTTQRRIQQCRHPDLHLGTH